MRRPEEAMAKKLANFIRMNYNATPFRFDLIDKISQTQGKINKELHGKFTKGYPDLFVCSARGKYGGLYLELKATDGLLNNDHTRTQAAYHSVLRYNGYKVSFCFKLDDCKKQIKKYMKKKRIKNV